MLYTDVTAAVIRENGKVLIAQRAPGEHLETFWEFPGGKIEKGETPEQSLKRELLEELGIDTRIGMFITESCFCYENKNIRLLAYEAENLGGEFSLKVHSAISWVALDDMDNYCLAPADIPIIEKLKHMSGFSNQ